MKVVTADQMRDIEARSEQVGVSTDTLMENAGLAVARRASALIGHLPGVAITVLVGPGNNGGDGLVTARHLQRWGARVSAYLCGNRPNPDPKLESARRVGIDIVRASDDRGLSSLESLLGSCHLVIDAILGTGRSRPIEGTLEEILGRLSDARVGGPRPRLLAMDLPTGLSCDTAEVDPSCVAADVTVSLAYPKRGHLGFPGADYVGSLEVVDIGIPAGLDTHLDLSVMTDDWARSQLPERPRDSHKGTYGRAMVVAGSRNFLGAAYLAATAATRVGAGLVTIAIPQSLIPAVASKAIEPTFVPLPESEPGVPAPGAAGVVLESLRGYSALLVGCGLGQAPQTRSMVRRILLSGYDLPPTVVDADGLNTLAQEPSWSALWRIDAVLTPHPGEMARLTGVAVNKRRIDVAREAAVDWNKTVVLKGAHTVVVHPDGSAMVSPYANPGLATAGTGDVLAGVIAGLVSQGGPLGASAALGVYIHGAAGEIVRNEVGDTGMIAGDLLAVIPRVIRDLRSSPRHGFTIY